MNCTLGFVYKWTDSTNGMYYIGRHKGSPDDGYIGSGFYFRRAYDTRPEAFSREILYYGEHFDELEGFILEEFDLANDPMSYNLVNTITSNAHFDEDARERMGRAHRGKAKKESTKKKMSLAAKGKPKSKSHKEAITKSLIGKTGKDSRNKKPVYCEYLNKEFATMKECAEALGVSYPVVFRVFNGRTKNNKYGIKRISK